MMYFLLVCVLAALFGYALHTPKSALVSKEEYEKYFRTNIMGMK